MNISFELTDNLELHDSLELYSTKNTAITPAPQALMQPQRTTLITWSRDQTNAAWIETGTSIAALDAVGMDGVANSACTLTDNDGTASEYTEQSKAITANTNTHTARAFIAKDAVTSRFAGFDLDLNTAGIQQRQLVHLNTSTGATASAAIAGAGGTFEANSVGDRWELLIEVANVNNTSALIGLLPADGTVIGTSAVAAIGSIIVGNVEFYENKTIDQIRGTSPIFTEAAAVTVDNDLIEIGDADNWVPASEGVFIAAITSDGDYSALGAEQYARVNTNTRYAYRNSNDDTIRALGGGGGPTVPTISQVPSSELIISAIWSSSLNKMQVGVYNTNTSTWYWDQTPATFSIAALDVNLVIGYLIAAKYNQRSLLIYDGLPPGADASLAAVQTWVEENAESEILKRQA